MKVGYRILMGRVQTSSVEKIQNTRVRCRQALLVSSNGIGWNVVCNLVCNLQTSTLLGTASL